jgi:arsenate reductase (thioredoxin)
MVMSEGEDEKTENSKKRVLAICIHNSARSQITEEYIRQYGDQWFQVESAGLEPGEINPIVTALLEEDGIDISGKSTQAVMDLYKAGRKFDYVIAVCSAEANEMCPIFPAEKERLHWPFPDPSKAEGTKEEKMKAVRPIRDQIKEKVKDFIQEHKEK